LQRGKSYTPDFPTQGWHLRSGESLNTGRQQVARSLLR